MNDFPARNLTAMIVCLAITVGVFYAATDSLAAPYVNIKQTAPGPSDAACPSGVCINSVTCTSAVSTGWIPVAEYDSVKIKWKLTDGDNSVTTVTVTCETTETYSTAAGSGFDICGRVSMDANATSTMACPHTWSYANAEADLATFTVDNLDDTYLQCTFTCTGTPAGIDLIYVEVRRRSP